MPVLYHKFADKYRQQVDALAILFGINTVFALRITPVQFCQILWMTDFLLGEHVVFTKQLLPRLRPRWYQRPLYGPADALDNVRFLEFVFADSYFVAYANSQDEQYLDLLLAVLYRPQRARYRPRAADYAGDQRQDFNENLVEARAQRLASLPEAEKLAVLTWYRGCRHALEQRYPHVFSPPAQTDARTSAGGWAQALREMSGQAFGSFDETGRQHLHTVMAKMEEDIVRAEALQRRAESQPNSY